MIDHKNNRIILSIICCIIIVYLSSCATMISGSTAKVELDGEVNEPVSIITSQTEYNDVKLPITVEVKRRHLGEQHIRFTSPSYAYHDIILHRTFNPWALGNIYLGVLPISVDLLTNGISEPMQKHFIIRPVAPRRLADSLWVADSLDAIATKEAYSLSRKPVRFPRHELNIGIGSGANQADHDLHTIINGYPSLNDYDVEGECFDLIGDSYLFINFEYHYRLNRKWDIGSMAAWGLSRDGNTYYSPQNQYAYAGQTKWIYDHETSRYFVVAPSVRYTLYETTSTRLYSRLCLGVMRHHLNYKRSFYDGNDALIDEPTESVLTDMVKWGMGYHITAIGGNIGTENIHFFGEIGYGCLGVVRIGASFSF